MDIRVIIIEDNREIREAYNLLINGTHGLQCVAQYQSAEDALEAFTKNGFDADVLCMDIELPGISGIDCVALLKQKGCEIPVMMLTAFDSDNNVFNALKAGALGYILKSASPVKILAAIEELAEGGSPMSGSIARKVLETFSASTHTTTDVEYLSQREQEILNELISGKRYQEIADALYISLETVRTHIRNIYKKLHVHSITEARRILRKQ